MKRNINYRQIARKSLARARDEIATNDPPRFRYAALELRDAIEALTYDRALAYKDELPPEEYKTWQPRKLMVALLEIDPKIGMTSQLSIGEEEEFGKPPPPKKMKVLGTDFVLGLADIKKHYDAIGSYLHVPSLDQIQTDKLPDITKLLKRCTELAKVIDEVLSSKVWNSTMGCFSTLPECYNEECKKPVRRRIPLGSDKMNVRCYNCDAEYKVEVKADGQVSWTPIMYYVPCSNTACKEAFPLWPSEFRVGTNWKCKKCKTSNVLRFSVSKLQDDSQAAP